MKNSLKLYPIFSSYVSIANHYLFLVGFALFAHKCFAKMGALGHHRQFTKLLSFYLFNTVFLDQVTFAKLICSLHHPITPIQQEPPKPHVKSGWLVSFYLGACKYSLISSLNPIGSYIYIYIYEIVVAHRKGHKQHLKIMYLNMILVINLKW